MFDSDSINGTGRVENSYSQYGVIEWHSCDIRGELRPSAFLNMTQEIAGFHANRLGFGYYDLIGMNQAWVLSRIRVKYLSHPRWCDKFRLETWHKGMQSLFGIRDFILFDGQGERAVVATTSWLIMNTLTHRIERQSGNIFNSALYTGSKNTLCHAIEEQCGRIRKADCPECVRTHSVLYSDVDYLGHANNARYVEWIMDTLDIDFIRGHKVREFQLNFNSETRIGDKIEIYKAVKPSAVDSCIALYFEGRRNGEVVFESDFIFEE